MCREASNWVPLGMICKTGRCSRVCRDLVNLALPTSFPGAPTATADSWPSALNVPSLNWAGAAFPSPSCPPFSRYPSLSKFTRQSRVKALAEARPPTNAPGASLTLAGGEQSPARRDAPGEGARRPGRESVVSRAGLRAALWFRGRSARAGLWAPDPRWPGTCLPVTQPRVGNVVRRRRRRYAPRPPARGRAWCCGRRRRWRRGTWSGRRAGKQDAGAGEGVGPGRGAQQRAGPPPLRYPADPERPRAGRPGPAVRGRPGGGRAAAGTRRRAPGTIPGRLVRGPRTGGREGLGRSGL